MEYVNSSAHRRGVCEQQRAHGVEYVNSSAHTAWSNLVAGLDVEHGLAAPVELRIAEQIVAIASVQERMDALHPGILHATCW